MAAQQLDMPSLVLNTGENVIVTTRSKIAKVKHRMVQQAATWAAPVMQERHVEEQAD